MRRYPTPLRVVPMPKAKPSLVIRVRDIIAAHGAIGMFVLAALAIGIAVLLIAAALLGCSGQTLFPTCDTPEQHCAPCKSDGWPSFCPSDAGPPQRAPRRRVPEVTPMGYGIASGDR